MFSLFKNVYLKQLLKAGVGLLHKVGPRLSFNERTCSLLSMCKKQVLLDLLFLGGEAGLETLQLPPTRDLLTY